MSPRLPVLALPGAEPAQESSVVLSRRLPSLSQVEAPLRRWLFCSRNFLQRRPVPSRPAHSSRNLRQAGWGEQPRPLFGDSPEELAGTRARKNTPKHRDTHSMGRVLGVLPAVLQGDVSSRHIWWFCIPSCCPAVQQEPAQTRTAPEWKPLCVQLPPPHAEHDAGSRTRADPPGKEPGGSRAGRAAQHCLAV